MLESHFCAQSRPNSCVAACCAMLAHRRGGLGVEPAAREAELLEVMAGWPIPPHWPSLQEVAPCVSARYASWDPDEDVAFEVLEATVALAWTAVEVMGGPWTVQLAPRLAGATPRFGPLVQPRYRGEKLEARAWPRHAVVLIEWGANYVAALDPWFGAESQPLQISAEGLRRAWVGSAAWIE